MKNKIHYAANETCCSYTQGWGLAKSTLFFAETKLDFLWVKLKFWLSIPSSQSYLIFYTFPLKKHSPIEDWPYLRPPAMLIGN